ncbi:hypothetical protein Taro_006322 [Colocasia esculenta]|uniref:Uncharacterized protein n=1 Tax=Colocasia esculenta TaxID=4460 RepID=A0A843TNE0_COLES|nr:hypothetical protein [Colocasia esculenta]
MCACCVAFTGAELWSVEPVKGLVGCPLVVGVCVVIVVFGLVCLCAVVRCARDAELSRCLACCVAPLVERYNTCLWLLSAWCWLVVGSGEVLPEFFLVGSGGSKVPQNCVVLVSGLFLARFCCYRATSESEVCCWFGWCVLEGFSQSGALVVLVEVLPGPACVASAILLTAVSFLMVRVVWSFGLCILVKVLPRIALCRFWWRFFPGVLRVCFGPPLCCPCDSKCAVWLGCVLVRFSQNGSWRFGWRFSLKLPCVCSVVVALSLCRDELSLLPVGLSVLQSTWALSFEVLCPWLCV